MEGAQAEAPTLLPAAHHTEALPIHPHLLPQVLLTRVTVEVAADELAAAVVAGAGKYLIFQNLGAFFKNHRVIFL